MFVYTYSFGIGPIKFELISLALLISHTMVNPDIKQSIQKLITIESTNPKSHTIDTSFTNLYEKKYSELADDEIDKMLKSDNYVTEVKAALTRIKEKRNVGKEAK